MRAGLSDLAYPQLERLKIIGEQQHQFGKKIKPARHKIIAHIDRDTAIKGEPLGAASQEEWNQFWINLQEFVHILYEHYLSDAHLYINGVSNTSGADSLIMALEQSRDLKKGAGIDV